MPKTWPQACSLFDQSLQRIHIPLIVARFFDGSLGDECGVCRSGIVEKSAEWFQSDTSLPDVLMTIEPRSTRGFGIVAVPNWDVLQSNRVLQILHRELVAIRRDNVVSRDVCVASIDACGDGQDWA